MKYLDIQAGTQYVNFYLFEKISYYKYVYTDEKLYNTFILPRKYTNIIEFVSKKYLSVSSIMW